MRILPELFHSPELVESLSSEEWNDLLPRLKSSGMLAHLGELLQLNQVDQSLLPPAVQRQLAAARSIAWVRARSCRWECGEIARALRGKDIPLMVVKGAAYVLADALPGRGRWLSDVDLLVPREHLVEVERVLLSSGWQASAKDEEDAEYFRRWLHQIPPLVHSVRGAMIDLHHTIIAPWGGYSFDVAALFREAVPSPVEGILLPSPVDRPLIAAAHFVRSEAGAGAFRDLLDLSELLRDPELVAAGGLSRVKQRASEVGISSALHAALCSASAYYPIDGWEGRSVAAWRAAALMPDGTGRPGAATRWYRRLQKIKALRAGLPLWLMAQRTLRRRLRLGRATQTSGN